MIREPRRAHLPLLLRGALAALASASALGFAGASGCGDTIDSRGESDPATPAETLGQAHQADATPVTCVTVRRGQGKAFDAMLSSEKAANNYGASTVNFIGAAAGGVDHFQSLLKFDLTGIPPGATITSANVALSQTNNGAGTWNAHLITAPWDESTVTWQSFAGAFDATTFKSGSTANPSIVFSVMPQVQAWVNGAMPNHGFLLEQPGAFQTKIKAQEWLVAGQRPTLTVCYKVTCAPGFADCNGDAADGCEADLASPASCGGCGNTCAFAHGAAGCSAGSCTLASCDLGWGNCDGSAPNGCETDLTTSSNCGFCGNPCSLPNATSSCATGTCKLVSCNQGAFDCDSTPEDGCELMPCGHGSKCAVNAGCVSGVCLNGVCANPACNDHAKNGTETDVDCGGSCPPCADGGGCGAASDCQSGVCLGGSCAPPGCGDGIKNGNETGTDCGGSCSPCSNGSGCGTASDCQSGVCLGGQCHAPDCSDGLKNGNETGVDCGGSCAPCSNGGGCLSASDCQSGVCAGGVCQIPSCADGVKNGNESDVDCGGSCPDCNDNQTCQGPGDCANGVCAAGHCQPATCSDGVKNGNETGIDCGGACTVPEVCNGKDDDCNGSVDDGLGTITCGLGACQVTVPACAGGVVQSCAANAPSVEVCDGVLDDDCDGVVDNGCDCVNGATQPCYSGSAATQGVGACHGGTQTCTLGHWGACQGEVTPAAETCNGKDDDCDGQTDEDLGTTICGIGGCQVMVQNCVGGAPQVCQPGSPKAESCNGADDDCNGQVDDGLGTISCGSGACAVSAPACVNGQPGACNPHQSDGLSCNDGHACTGNDACQNGTCAGALVAAGTVCRASTGACDPAESCTGAAADCPADAKSAAGTVCRASAGVCDVAETCNGASAACPADGFASAATVCRASAGACDLAENCTGSSAACPADGFAPAGTSCRAAANECDLAESCTGASISCPADSVKAAGTACSTDGNSCTTDACNGTVGAPACSHAAILGCQGNPAASCLAILNAGASTGNGVYWIDPDGAGAGAAFQVYCDMTTSGGGWTALPLRFADATMWTISQSGSACVTINAKDNVGTFQQSFSSVTGTFANTALTFVPPMTVNAVRLVAFKHSNSGTCNSMDFDVGVIPSGANTSHEGWYFSNGVVGTARAFVFPSTPCPAPYVTTSSGPAYCTLDSALSSSFFTIDRTLNYSSSSNVVQMVLVQGCQSSVCSPATNGERFFVNMPPDADGIWRNGIFVR
ncbi:MAG: DNRLRE domain-containing protein [Byssovorax sp.]